MIHGAKQKFDSLENCSFDKGFYSPSNKKELSKLLKKVILPKKGKLSKIEKEEEHSEAFVKARNKHSAVESAINALENHSLDRCPDRGIEGFKRYVSMGILERNIQILGNIIHQRELKKQNRQSKLKYHWQKIVIGLHRNNFFKKK